MISVEGLRFTYSGNEDPTLRGFDFSVEDNEIFGFLGPSGAGKSTTQKVLTGLLDGYEGSVEVKNREVRDWGKEYYKLIGVSPESPNHYLKLTGRENLELFGSLYGGKKRELEELFELVNLADAIDNRVGEYSKGMKMRLNFIRSLLHNPEILFLDEPTTGIDPGNARNIKDTIAELGNDRTVFLTTHDMTVADELCDRVGFLVDGKLPVVDEPEELKSLYGSRIVRVAYEKDGSDATERFLIDGLGDNESFQHLLKEEYVRSIHTEEATLEDVFLEVTGETLS